MTSSPVTPGRRRPKRFPRAALAVIALAAPAAAAAQTAEVDVSGLWDDAGRAVTVVQSGASVTATFDEPPLCDPRDGSEPRPRETDFEGTLTGRRIEGRATVCNYGESWGAEIGIQEVDMILELSEDGRTLSGTYEGWQGPEEFSLTRRCGAGPPVESREAVVAAIVDGFRAAGSPIGPGHVIAGRKEGSDMWTWAIRLDAEFRPLPSGTTILAAGEAGLIEEGRQAGARWLLLGSIQVWREGGRTRVTARNVEVETGVVDRTGGGDADGLDRCAVAEAMAGALAETGLPLGEPRGLTR